MQKTANKFSGNIMFFMLLATLALILMGTVLTKPASDDFNSTAQQIFAESAASDCARSGDQAFCNPGVILRVNTIRQ